MTEVAFLKGNGIYYDLALTVFVIFACAMLIAYAVARVTSYSHETPKTANQTFKLSSLKFQRDARKSICIRKPEVRNVEVVSFV